MFLFLKEACKMPQEKWNPVQAMPFQHFHNTCLCFKWRVEGRTLRWNGYRPDWSWEQICRWYAGLGTLLRLWFFTGWARMMDHRRRLMVQSLTCGHWHLHRPETHPLRICQLVCSAFGETRLGHQAASKSSLSTLQLPFGGHFLCFCLLETIIALAQ